MSKPEEPTGQSFDHKERTYRDPMAAHEYAMKLKSAGHSAIRIRSDGSGTHTVSWQERAGDR